MLAVLLLLQMTTGDCGPSTTPAPQGAPALVVQTVDPRWLPVPGVRITVTRRGDKVATHTAATGRDGYVFFSIPTEAEYSIEARSPAFKKRLVKWVRTPAAAGASPTAFVQLQLAVRSGGTVYVE